MVSGLNKGKNMTNASYLRAQTQYDNQTPDESEFQIFVEQNEDKLMALWDTYKFEELSDEFHYDDVDFYDDDMFLDMAELVFEGKLSL